MAAALKESLPSVGAEVNRVMKNGKVLPGNNIGVRELAEGRQTSLRRDQVKEAVFVPQLLPVVAVGVLVYLLYKWGKGGNKNNY